MATRNKRSEQTSLYKEGTPANEKGRKKKAYPYRGYRYYNQGRGKRTNNSNWEELYPEPKREKTGKAAELHSSEYGELFKNQK